MGCGCRKKINKTLTPSRKASILSRQAVLKSKMKTAQQAQKLRAKIIKMRLDLCTSCPHSSQNSRDKKYNVKICHKLNRPVSTVAQDLSMGCPVGKFKPSN